MPSAKMIAGLLSILCACAMAKPVSAQISAPKRIVIAASAVLDGKGRGAARHSPRHRRRKDCRD